MSEDPGRKARRRETAALLAVARVASATTDFVDALRLICRELARLTGAETVAAYVRRTDGGELSPISAYRVPGHAREALSTARLSDEDQRGFDAVFRSGRLLWSDDLPRDPRFAIDLFRRFPHQSGLMIPFFIDGRVAGAFYLVWWTARRRFEEAELATLETIGEQAGVLLRNARLHEALNARARRLHALARLNQLVSSLEPDDVLAGIAAAAAELMQVPVVSVWVADAVTRRLDARAVSGEPGLSAFARRVFAFDESGVGWIAEHRQPLEAADVTLDPRFGGDAWWTDHRLPSFLGVPIVFQDLLLGVLVLSSRAPFAFGVDDRELLDIFVSQSAAAIAKARLFQDIQDRRRLTEDLYALTQAMNGTMDLPERVEIFATGARRALHFERINVWLASGDDAGLELVAGTDLDPVARRQITLEGSGAFHAVWESRRTLMVASDADLAGVPPLPPELRDHPVLRTRRFALVPLLFQGRPIGVVSADNKPTRGAVTRRAVAHLELFCQQLATSVNNARLYGETRQRERDATILLEVTRKLSATLELDQVLDLVADGTIEALGCAAAGFYRWDAARAGLVFVRGRNHSPEFSRQVLLKPGEGVTGRAYLERRPVWTNDWRADPTQAYSAHSAEVMGRPGAPRAALAVPIVIRDEVFGVLGGSYPTPHVFTEREVNLLASLAAQGAVAIENARLYSVTRQNLAGAALLNEAARTLHRTLDVKRLLPDAAGTLGQTFGASHVGIVLFDEPGAKVSTVISWGAWPETTVRTLAAPLRRRETPLLVPDTASRPDLATTELLGPESQGLAAFPVRGRSRVLGGLVLRFAAPRNLSEAETRLLAAYADQLAMALDNAVLFEEAENQKTRLEQVFASTSDGFLVLDLNRRVVALNQQGGVLLGVDPHEVIGRPFARLTETPAASVEWEEAGGRALVTAIDRAGEAADGDLVVQTSERRTLRWLTTPTRDLLGAVVGTTITLRDVTREREIDRMKSEFVSTVSHELRTPLTSIKGSLHLLLSDEGLVLDQTQRHLVDISLKNTDRLIRLINNILDISKMEAGQIHLDLDLHRPWEFIDMAVEGIRGFADSRGISIESKVEPEVPRVQVDFDRMVQVVTNLLSNAIKFSPERGIVTVGARPAGGAVEIWVTDQGPGIAPEDVGRLFRKFQQLDGRTVRAVGGTGLGLAICRGIVEEHGGRIGVASRPGAGATFTVHLPAPGRAEAPPDGPRPGERDEAPLVLVVEDDADVRALMTDVLQMAGFRIIEAGRVLDGVELARERRPDVITMDLMLPDLDGFEAIRLLREQRETRDTPVVVLSAIEVEPGDPRALGATLCLTKPFVAAELVEAIRSQLRPREEVDP